MRKATLEALKGSIKHWEENVGITVFSARDASWRSCALCIIFFNTNCVRKDKNGRVIEKCPVYKKTGKATCYGSPYAKAAHAENLEAFRAAAKAELAFLKSLLPEGEG